MAKEGSRKLQGDPPSPLFLFPPRRPPPCTCPRPSGIIRNIVSEESRGSRSHAPLPDRPARRPGPRRRGRHADKKVVTIRWHGQSFFEIISSADGSS